MAGKVTAGLAAQSIGLGSRRRCAFVYMMSFTGCLLRNCRSAHCHDAEMTRHVISVYSSRCLPVAKTRHHCIAVLYARPNYICHSD